LAEQWKFDRHINVGHIATTAIVAVSLVVAFVRLESKVELNADNIEDNSIAIIASERRQSEKFSEIKALLIRIEEKLDRKADK